MKKTLIIAAAIGLMSSAASADLTGTTLDMELVQSGFTGGMAGPTGGIHTYGGTDTFYLLDGPSWDATSPAQHPALDNSILIDLTDFQYSSYFVLGPSTSTLDITNLAEDVQVGSAAVFLLGDLTTSIATATSESGNSLSVDWDVQAVVNDSPGSPSVMIAWSSVPAPGALALLGLAGVVPFTRRRNI